jgi:hypothetical protein
MQQYDTPKTYETIKREAILESTAITHDKLNNLLNNLDSSAEKILSI